MFPQSRDAALSQWQTFLPQAPAYGASRSLVVPGHPHVTRLSPAISRRLITEEELLTSLQQAHPLARVEKLAQEILWRPYWKGWLEHHPAVWSTYRTQVAALTPAHEARLANITAGRSGIAIMDYFIRELLESGWLHNHARLWVAAWWVHHERLPWELGAHFFLQHLLDADPASNTLSWRWVAGRHTRGKAYLVRRSNLEACLDPSLLAQHSAGLERLADEHAAAVPLPPEPDFPATAVNPLPSSPGPLDGRWGVWVHEEDLALETYPPLAGLRPQAVGSILSHSFRVEQSVSDQRWDHLRACLRDGATRLATHFQCPADVEAAPQLAQGLADWAHARQLQTVVTLQPWVGPLADQLPAVIKALQSRGIRLVRLRRPFDALLLPHSTKGFFHFWKSAQKALALDLPVP